MPTAAKLRDWAEDAQYENGDYLNTCTGCNQDFIGYKRRVVCKVCATKTTTAIEQDRIELQETFNEAGC